MRIAVTGSRGLIGSSLVPYLRVKGHEVLPVVRGTASPGEVLWDPKQGTIEHDKLLGIDAVVHLAGAGVGDRRWSPSYKQLILSSRVDGTTTLAEALAHLAVPPSVMVSASAVGYYGSQGDEILSEDAPRNGILGRRVCAVGVGDDCRGLGRNPGGDLAHRCGAEWRWWCPEEAAPTISAWAGGAPGKGLATAELDYPPRCRRGDCLPARRPHPVRPIQHHRSRTGFKCQVHQGVGACSPSAGPTGRARDPDPLGAGRRNGNGVSAGVTAGHPSAPAGSRIFLCRSGPSRSSRHGPFGPLSDGPVLSSS